MNEMNDSTTGGTGATGSGPQSQAVETLQERADIARQEASGVAQEARHEVRALADEAKEQLRGRVDQQGEQLGAAVREFGDDLASMARSAERPDGAAARTVSQVGDRLTGLADDMQQRGVGGILDDVTNFARQHPGQFVLGAAVAGFVVGRVVRNVDTGAITEQMRDGGGDSQRSPEPVLDLTSGEGELQLPAPPPMAGTRGSIAGVAGEEVGTW
jgi:hypothetical protein